MPRCAKTIKRRLSHKGAAIALIVALPAAAAYGATWGLLGPAGPQRHHSPIAGVPLVKKQLPRPWITAQPKTSPTTATFRLDDRVRDVRFECHLDASPWRGCGRTVTYASVESGRHRFYARATRGARKSRIAAFTWTVEEPVIPTDEAPVIPADTHGLPFAVTQSGPPPLLYPGAGPSPLSLTLSNPNPDPIEETSLTVDVTGGPAGCNPNVNVRVQPSPASPANPLVIPGNGTLAVAAAQAPTIELAESGTNQDACRGGSFSLRFSGSAQG
jgi:hypothetical protein